MNKCLLFLAALLFAIPAFPQFSLEGDFRPRAEFRRGYQRMPYADDKPAAHISQRTRLILGFTEDRVTTRLSLQDVRIWGDALPLTDGPSFDLHEAWIQLALTDSLFIRAGRQEIRYDNQRLFAVNDWNNVARTHDALVLRYLGKSGELHVGAAFNQNAARQFGTEYGRANYKTLNYIRYQSALAANLDVSLLAVADGYESEWGTNTLYLRGTWSAFLTYSPASLAFRVNPAFQHGTNAYGNSIRSAYLMMEASGNPGDNVRSTLGFEWLSGNDFENLDETFRAFDPLFGAGHGVHGYMDYFTNILVHTSGAGLVNPYLKNNIRLSGRSALDVDLHLFYLQNNYPDLPGLPPASGEMPRSLEKYLGTEVDLTLNYRFNAFTQLRLGYSVMFGTESMAALKGGDKDEFAHWAFVMLRVRPKFL
jgi:hypothetical protein